MIERLLPRSAHDFGALPCGWRPLDIDTFAMDNNGTAKQRDGRTYAGVDSYYPLAAYLVGLEQIILPLTSSQSAGFGLMLPRRWRR